MPTEITLKDFREVSLVLAEATLLKQRHEHLHKLYQAAKDERDMLRRERATTIVCLFVGMIGMFLFGVWLAGKAGCPTPKPTQRMHFEPSPIENAPTVAGVGVWL